MTPTRTAERDVKLSGNGSGSIRLDPRRRVNRGRLVLGVLLVAGFALVSALLYANVGQRRAVLAVARPVDAGQVIEAADLAEVRVSADPGLSPVPAGERDGVVGRVASTRLVPGTLLTAEHFSASPGLQPGRAEVGVPIKAGQAPSGLRPGDAVLLVVGQAPEAVLAESPLPQVINGALVTSVDPATDGSATMVVSVELGEGDASTVAAASVQGRVSVVRVATR